jgi:hypothetical protein
MDVDEHDLCHLHKIRPIAIGCDHLPVGTFSLDIQLPGNHFTHHPDLGSAINDYGKLVPEYLPANT